MEEFSAGGGALKGISAAQDQVESGRESSSDGINLSIILRDLAGSSLYYHHLLHLSLKYLIVLKTGGLDSLKDTLKNSASSSIAKLKMCKNKHLPDTLQTPKAKSISKVFKNAGKKMLQEATLAMSKRFPRHVFRVYCSGYKPKCFEDRLLGSEDPFPPKLEVFSIVSAPSLTDTDSFPTSHSSLFLTDPSFRSAQLVSVFSTWEPAASGSQFSYPSGEYESFPSVSYMCSSGRNVSIAQADSETSVWCVRDAHGVKRPNVLKSSRVREEGLTLVLANPPERVLRGWGTANFIISKEKAVGHRNSPVRAWAETPKSELYVFHTRSKFRCGSRSCWIQAGLDQNDLCQFKWFWDDSRVYGIDYIFQPEGRIWMIDLEEQERNSENYQKEEHRDSFPLMPIKWINLHTLDHMASKVKSICSLGNKLFALLENRDLLSFDKYYLYPTFAVYDYEVPIPKVYTPYGVLSDNTRLLLIFHKTQKEATAIASNIENPDDPESSDIPKKVPIPYKTPLRTYILISSKLNSKSWGFSGPFSYLALEDPPPSSCKMICTSKSSFLLVYAHSFAVKLMKLTVTDGVLQRTSVQVLKSKRTVEEVLVHPHPLYTSAKSQETKGFWVHDSAGMLTLYKLEF